MQKQKTIAKWLAIVVLCSVAVGSYLLYDALYVDKSNNQATADDVVDNPSDNLDEPIVDTPVHVPYYTTLPRPTEIIDGVGVTHFGGEGDDVIHDILHYGGKRLALFSSNSVEYDMREGGLSVAVIGEGVERVTHLASTTYLDSIISTAGPLVLTVDNDGAKVYLLDGIGQVRGQIALPKMTDGILYLSKGEVLLFYISNGYLHCSKILENMVVQNNPFVLKTDCAALDHVFDTALGQGIVASAGDSTKIYTFEQNKGFMMHFSQDKLLFKQLITAGNATDCNYVFLGLSYTTPTLISFDQQFQIMAVKTVSEATDGVVLPYGDGVCFVGNGITKSYCKHLDNIGDAYNNLSFDKVLYRLPLRSGFLMVVMSNSACELLLVDGQNTKKKPLDFSGEIAGVSSTSRGFSILVNTTSNLGIFRGNFGGVEPYVIDFDLSIFDSTGD